LRNVNPSDSQLDILHLPAEKKVGLKEAFYLIACKGRSLDQLSEKEYARLVGRLLSSRKFVKVGFQKMMRKLPVFSAK